ncbi:MAG: tetratricopeptide repeat protein [Planctomycetota bacterium]|nr:tetratricopeptide repeat protein [Planctomycetota bacterium]
MEREFTRAEADRHNALTERGWALTDGLLFIHAGDARGQPGWAARRKLQKAIGYFEQALAINPGGWSSMWALGKIYQRLGETATSLGWFTQAHQLNPDQPDVAREAGLAALDGGEAELAVYFCTAAVDAKPEDAGLVANLALAHMLAGDDAASIRCARSAVQRDPDDSVSNTVLALVQGVAEGTRERPKTLRASP